MVNLTINGIKVQAEDGMTILEAAHSAGINILPCAILKVSTRSAPAYLRM
jgi:predicted molibdopterin-dependent oxidoreductase YjgC